MLDVGTAWAPGAIAGCDTFPENPRTRPCPLPEPPAPAVYGRDAGAGYIYSALSATSGSTRAARRAGSRHASTAVTSKAVGAAR